MAGRFEGKVAFVTGAAAGMGRDTSIAFAKEGARVAVVDNRLERARQTVDLVREAGGTAEAFEADVRHAEQVEAAVAGALAAFGGIDLLVNNAGTMVPGSVVESSEEEWDLVVDTNLKGTFLVSRAVLPGMLERGSGAVVNIGSVSGMFGDHRMASYNAAKGGVVNLTRSMAVDFGGKGIRVNCICPGAIGTPVIRRIMSDRAREAMAAATPVGRIGEPEEIVRLTLFLCSDDASYINGAVIAADGGLTAGSGLPG